ncbi:MAG: hypothetical protein HUK15_05375, partial [Bacteroidales bacterium]|nr:hypothetical protein [Bacteroidales bacterium]
MRLPSNILYFVRSKENDKLPAVFGEFILNADFQMCSYLDACEYRTNLCADKTVINVTDFGTGSNGARRVGKITKSSA